MENTIIQNNFIEREFVEKIATSFSNYLVKIIFFGSRAKGTAKPWSDFDFLIVLTERNNKVIDEIYDVVIDFLITYGVDISLKIYKDKDFQKMISFGTPFIESVLKTGKVLWTRKRET